MSICYYLADCLRRVRPEEAAPWLRMLSLKVSDGKFDLYMTCGVEVGVRGEKTIGLDAKQWLKELYDGTSEK